MYQQTLKNGAPVWELTELAVEKGRQLAKRHYVDEDLVIISLYLAHVVFDEKPKSEIQLNHTILSAKVSVEFLKKEKVDEKDIEVVKNAIEAHHAKVPTKSLTAEVVKNAECFKFIKLKGALIFLHSLGERGYTYGNAVKYVLEKMNQKLGYLTLEDCKKESEEKKIIELFK